MSFDSIRLFRVLHFLSEENDFALLAQDSYPTLHSCIDQLQNIGNTINQFKVQSLSLDDKSLDKYAAVVSACNELGNRSAEILPLLEELLSMSHQFWFCSPLDKILSRDDLPQLLWDLYDTNKTMDSSISASIAPFKLRCRYVADMLFPGLRKQLELEEALAASRKSDPGSDIGHLANEIPLIALAELIDKQGSMITRSLFPGSHYLYVSPSLSRKLHFCVARLLAYPICALVLNMVDVDSAHLKLVGISDAVDVNIFMKTARNNTVNLHWEISHSLQREGVYDAAGVDVTDDMASAKATEAASAQRMLRQWLHSIRNASFERQAGVILEDLEHFQAAFNAPGYESYFSALSEGLHMLIHTANTSVGLIDEALAVRGDLQVLALSDFAHSLRDFPRNFAISEGIGTIPIELSYCFDGVDIDPAVLSSYFVRCDTARIQAFTDNVITNAVRYTDPKKGIRIKLDIVNKNTKLRFTLRVSDYCVNGFPRSAIEYLSSHIADFQFDDARPNAAVAKRGEIAYDSIKGELVGKGRSTKTGLPHLVELNRKLNENGAQMEFSISTCHGGSTVQFSFNGNLNAPVVGQQPKDIIFEPPLKGTLLVVDDSAIIRRIAEKDLTALGIRHALCKNGSDAFHWLMGHSEECCGVLTDFEMPLMNGSELISMIMQSYPAIPCFLMSGNEMTAVEMATGARRSLLKPLSQADIRSVVKEIWALQHKDRFESPASFG